MGLGFCWLATVLCLPAVLAASEKLFPLERKSTGIFSRIRAAWGAGFGKPFAWIVPLAPRAITVIGVGLALAGFVALVGYVRSDPMEYDMGRLRNDRKARATEEHYKKLADDITGYVGSDGMALLVDDPAQVGPLRDALYKVRDAASPEKKPFEAIFALEDFVPKEQAEKVPTLLKLKDKIERARRKGVLKEEDYATISRYLPPDDLTPFGMSDLPCWRGHALHRDRRHARAHRLHQPDQGRSHRGRALSPALGRVLPGDAPSRRLDGRRLG